MPTIYLARHGQDLDNANGILNGRRDQPLTAIGFDQARQLAEKIKAAGLQFDKIYCSPLRRAFQTAQVIAAMLEVNPPDQLELLIERDFGVMSGLPAREIETLCAPHILKTNTITYFLSPEGAETFPALLTRAEKLLAMLSQIHKDETILLVTHGDIGKMLYAAFYRLEWQETLSSFHFGNSELLELSSNRPPENPFVFSVPQFNH